MTDTTGQEATPNTQEGQGQAVELEQSQAEQDASAWTLEKAEARLKELNAENAKWHKRFREVEKAKTDAEAAVMAEQGKYKELYQSAKAKADAADALQERLDAITAQAQAADGQQTELEQPNSEHAQALSPEQLRAELEAARKEAASYRTKLRQTEKQATDAEAKRLAEQGEYRTLYESVKAKADAADALQERLDAITAQAQAANERRIAAIPEHMRSLVPEYDDALKLAAWLDANAAVFSRPTPPPLDGRAGGNGGPLLDEAAIKAQAVRLGLDPEGYYRQAQQSAIKR